jgi:hypothetical protein
MTDLRRYQSVVIAECNQIIANGQKRLLIVAPTGAGKTVIAADIIKSATVEERRVLVLSHTREIIKQTSLKLSGYQVDTALFRQTWSATSICPFRSPPFKRFGRAPCGPIECRYRRQICSSSMRCITALPIRTARSSKAIPMLS